MGRLTLASKVMSSSKTSYDRQFARIPKVFRKSLIGKVWKWTCLIMTLFFPRFLLSLFKIPRGSAQSAWREKFTLCSLIVISCLLLGFITYGMSMVVCQMPFRNTFSALKKRDVPMVLAFGRVYVGTHLDDSFHLTNVSPYTNMEFPSCRMNVLKDSEPGIKIKFEDLADLGDLFFSWNDIAKQGYSVVNGVVLDGTVVDPSCPLSDFLRDCIGRDCSIEAKELDPMDLACLKEAVAVGRVFLKSYGCVMADIVLYASTAAIFGLIGVRFALAAFWHWAVKARMAGITKYTVRDVPCVLLVTAYCESFAGLRATLDSLSSQARDMEPVSPSPNGEGAGVSTDKNTGEGDSESNQYKNRVIVVVADGDVRGSESEQSTQALLRKMVQPLPGWPRDAKDYIALADGDKRHNRATVIAGFYRPEYQDRTNVKYKKDSPDKSRSITNIRPSRQKKLSITDSQKIKGFPIILVLKEGSEKESGQPRAGNRGKRDSQVIIMGFFQRLAFNDLLVPLDYELYRAFQALCPEIDPARYEAILMVDADTAVEKNAVRQMLALLDADQDVIGLCGETRILNKTKSWVTAIQVFEYYVSHHLAKAFESVFGGVTCIPGCFGMYRLQELKRVRGETFSLPVLVHPFILAAYSSIETKTLHQKNLLLLGEDRYLTTLLLKNFSHRKLVFCPTAICYTEVPADFGVLLSQRRRWINSTVHNYFELAMVDQLCGTFCCSMKFVVIMELSGTLVLPAAIIFTVILIARSILIEPAWIPLIMLFGILGLPAVLVGITTFELSQLIWLIIYIISLPIWNFVLPTYAFWHFDDFSWGETRKIIGDSGGGHGESSGKYDLKECKVGLLSDLVRQDPLPKY